MSHVPSTPPETWTPIRRAASAMVAPIQRLLAIEAASGVALLVATLAALIWANVSSTSYENFWHLPIGFRIGPWAFEQSLHFWVAEGLMTVFFLVVGLEIRREIHDGELATLRRAALPLAAAAGGMLVPAVIFAVLNAGRAGSAGWAIPMATDIAFAVGVLTLLGKRVPPSLRILLLSLAVVDDIGAIIVIALLYNTGASLAGFAVIAAGVATVLVMRGGGVRAPLLYVAPGAVIWAGFLMSGIHPTIAGVVLGMLTPARPWNGASPVERLTNALHPWVAFVVMPVFALASAGVVLASARFSGDYGWLFAGVVLGLAAGKPLGIAAAALLATRTGFAERAEGLGSRGVLLVGLVGGIGFTMSLFIAQLAFPPGPLLETAKLAILVGSGVAIVAGLVFGYFFAPPRPR